MRKGDLNISEVIKSEGGVPDRVSVAPARVVKGVPKYVLDWLRVTANEPDIEWKVLENEKGERIAVLIKKVE